MTLDIIAFALAGCGLGMFTGTVPGIHVNSAVAIIIPVLGVFNPYLTAAMIIAMAISHTIFDFVPSVLLGMPEGETALSVLPGHRMLMEGRGLEAIYLTVIGGTVVTCIACVLLPLLIAVIPFFYQNIHSYIHFALAAIASVVVLTEDGSTQKIKAFICLSLSGALGYLVLNSYVLPSTVLFLPLFTGLFGLSTLIISLRSSCILPMQSRDFPRVRNTMALVASAKALFSGVLVGTLPGIGASQATVLTQQLTKNKDQREFMISLGGINTVVALFSLVSLYTISKARSGAAVAVHALLPEFHAAELAMLAAVALLSAGVSSLVLMAAVKKMISLFERIRYLWLTLFVIMFLVSLTVIFSGLFGLLVLVTSTAIGMLAPLWRVKRSSLMGVLMIPLIIFYLGI